VRRAAYFAAAHAVAAIAAVAAAPHPLSAPLSLQTSREQADRLLAHGEQLLADWQHPNPIICELKGRGGVLCCPSTGAEHNSLGDISCMCRHVNCQSGSISCPSTERESSRPPLALRASQLQRHTTLAALRSSGTRRCLRM
jgi:hypothetical protein